MLRKKHISIFFIILLAFLLAGCNWFGTYSISGIVTDQSGRGISGITIVYEGKITGKVTTSATGEWMISRAKGLTTIKPISSSWEFDPPQISVDHRVSNLKITGIPQFTMAIQVEGSGTVMVYPEKDKYEPGDQVTLTPDADEGFVFSHWIGGITSDEIPLTLTINSGVSLTAIFVPVEEVVNISDPNLEQAVRNTLNKPFGVITKDEVETLVTLDASIMPVNTLEGIQYFTNLQWLDLKITGISNISPLSGLTGLQHLDLGFNNITSIAPLTNLVNLNVLRLNDNSLSDIKSLFWSSVKDLEELDLSGNKITNIDTLKGLSNLGSHVEILNLSKNQIVDITPLANLTTLRELNLSSNQIVSISNTLSKLPNIEKLDLQKNKISDITELAWFWDKNLVELNLSHNPLGNLQPIAGIDTMEKLYLKNAGITDISDLRDYPNIKELDLSHNQLTDISALRNLTSLEVLYLHNNLLVDISPLVDLISLQKVTLMDNEDLNFSKGSPADQVIQTLRNRGCVVLYDYYQNDAPILEEIGSRTIYECDELTIVLKARDPNGDELTYRAEGELAQYFDPETHTFSWQTGYEDAGIYTVTFYVSDGDIEISEEIIVEVINVNRPPQFVGLEDMSVNENETLTFTLEAIDEDGQPVTFDATSDDLDLYSTPAKFDRDTATFTWTPGYDDSGTYEVTFMVSDGEDTVSQTITITVVHVNRPPVLQEIGDFTVLETETVYFEIIASDPDKEDTLSYSVTCTDPDLVNYYDPYALTFNWVTDYYDAGTYVVTVTVDDGTTTVSEDVTIEVLNNDRGPVLDPIGPKTVNEYDELTFTIHATDPDGDPITYSMTPLPGATLDPNTGVFSWIPNMDDMLNSPHQVTFTASAGSLEVSETITITVLNVEFPPVLEEIGPQTVDENQQLEIILQATDLDRDPLTYSATSTDLDITSKFIPEDGVFRWTPGYEDSGIYHVTFTVSDGDQIDSEDVTITVMHVNRPPVLDPIGNKVIQELDTLTFTVTASDADAQDSLTFRAESDTPGLANLFNPDTQVFEWVTDYEDEGTYYITFFVSDGHTEVSEEIQIVVNKLDRPPVLSPIGNQNVNDNELLNFFVSATDPDNDPITYTMSPILAGATLDQQTGEFRWTPGNAQIRVEPYEVTFFANTIDATVSETIYITVHDVNHAPVLEPIGNKRVFENKELTFTINYYDVDEDPVTLEVYGDLVDKFDPDSNTFYWKPGYTDHGFYDIEFVVSDGIETVSELVEVEVVDVDAVPVINPIGNQTFICGVDDFIAFTVDAYDPDGDPILLSAEGLPPTASFNSITGDFVWTPGVDDIGEHTVTFIATANGKQTSQLVTISVKGAKLEITDVGISLSNIEVGVDSVNLTATIRNTGDLPGEFNLSWAIYKNNNGLWEFSQTLATQLESISAGDERILTIDFDLVEIESWVSPDDDLPLDCRIYAEIADVNVGGPVSNYVEFTLIPPQKTLTISISGNGSVNVDPVKETYNEGETVTLTADPDEGYTFYEWNIDGVSYTTKEIQIVMDTDKIVYATFTPLNLGSGNKFAFISTRDNSYGEIYLMENNGTITRLTNNIGIKESDLVWSPDGSKIAFVGELSGNKDIYVVDVYSKVVTRLTTNSAEDICPDWSPYGDKIVFSSNRNGNHDIFVMYYNGSGLTRLTKNNLIDEIDPAWSSDGNLIVYSYAGDLYSIDPNDLDPVPVLVSDYPSLYKPKWSPDGTEIIAEGTDGDLYLIEFTGSSYIYDTWNDPYQVTTLGANSPVWNPLGGQIAFVSTRDGAGTDIYRLDKGADYNVDPIGVTRMTDSFYDDFEPSYSSDGLWIAFTSNRDGNNDIYVVNTNDPTDYFRLTKNEASDTLPVWAP